MSELHRHFIRKVRDDGMTNAIIAGVGFIIIKIRLLFQRLSSGGPEIIKEIEGSQMKLDVRLTSPNKLERHLALKGIREPQTTKKYREILERTKERGGTIHIFDIGANVGYYALLGAHILDKEGKIYAIEAEPNNADRLRQNIELNDYSQIKVFQVAAGEERSTQNLNVREKSNIHKMGELTSKKKKRNSIDVNVFPIDELVENERITPTDPIIIRMDIEGYEHRAFQGLENTLSSDRPMYILVEIHDREHNPKRAIIELLEENNFTPQYITSADGDQLQEIQDFKQIPETGNIHLFAERGLVTN